MIAQPDDRADLSRMLDLFTSALRLSIDSQTVVALRLLRIAQGGRVATDESQLMVMEKISAFAEAQSTVAQHVIAGRGSDAASSTMALYHRKVTSNIRRLS